MFEFDLLALPVFFLLLSFFFHSTHGSTQRGGIWYSSGSPGVMLNIDCDSCAIGTHAKAMLEDSSPLTWNMTTSQVGTCEASRMACLHSVHVYHACPPVLTHAQIQVDGCPGKCLTTGITAGALPSCAGNETWFTTQVFTSFHL